jgi:hypothetical protein
MPARIIGPSNSVVRTVEQARPESLVRSRVLGSPHVLISAAGLLVLAYTTEPGDAPAAHHDAVQYGTELAVFLCFLVVAGRVVCRRWVARSS